MVIEASAGDYRFLLMSNGDGSLRCMRTLVDGSNGPEDVADWTQLPETVRNAFLQAKYILVAK